MPTARMDKRARYQPPSDDRVRDGRHMLHQDDAAGFQVFATFAHGTPRVYVAADNETERDAAEARRLMGCE